MLGESIDGKISLAGDVDYFRVIVRSADLPSSLDDRPHGDLRTEYGRSLRAWSCTSNDDGSDGYNFRVLAAVEPAHATTWDCAVMVTASELTIADGVP